MNQGDEPDWLAENRALRGRVAELERQLSRATRNGTFLESVLEAVPAFIANLDPDLKIRFFNRYQPGHTLESAVGTQIFDYIDPSEHERARAAIEQARKTGQTTSYRLYDAAGANGALANYLVRVAPVREPDGRIGVCLVCLDVTVEDQRVQALRDSQEKLALALEASGLGLWTWDLEHDTTVMDERHLALCGRDEAPAPSEYVDGVVHPDDREGLLRDLGVMLTRRKLDPLMYRVCRPDGTIRWVLTCGRVYEDESGRIVKLVGGTLDITHQRELEEQVRKAQRMEAVGSLTAGIAHNFNNMLAVISPTLEIASFGAPPPQQPLLQDAIHAASRAAELVRQLMTYAGRGASDERATCEIAGLVHAAVGICRRAFDSKITLGVEQQGPACTVVCSPGQIEQLLVNLLLNARDAVQSTESQEGSVIVRIRAGTPEEWDAEDLRAMVCIDVLDDGIGMTEQVRARLFEPFFTTKGVGKGTGLGLATSFAIAREHRGKLSCRSEPGKGTRFTLALPISHEQVSVRPLEEALALSQRAKVLLVDDDEVVRRTLGYVLAEAGHSVVTAADGACALAQLSVHRDVRLVLLDRSMPGGDGERFVSRMRSLAPAARIVFVSGRIIEPELIAEVDASVQKPVTRSALLGVIERVLTS